MWPILGVIAVLATGAFVAWRRSGAGPPAAPDQVTPPAPSRSDAFEGRLLRAEMVGILELLDEREGGAPLGLDAAARALNASRVRVGEAAEELEGLGLLAVLSPLRSPDAVTLTDAGRDWLARHPSA